MIDYVIKTYENIISKNNINLNLQKTENFKIIGDRDKLIEIFTNLIDNSIKYSEIKIKKLAPDADFTKEQLWRALAAKVDVDGKLVENPYKKWSDIDASLPNKKIEILIAPPTSGTRDAWNSLVMGKGCTKTAKSLYDAAGKKAKKECAKMREDGYAVEAGENDTLIVQKLTSNPDAYGFFGYSYLVANKDKVKAASIEGVQPSLEGIQDYSYPIARPLFFYVKKAHIGVVPGIEEYLKEFTSKKSMGNRGYLAKIGLVPLASDKYKVTRTAALDLNTINIK